VAAAAALRVLLGQRVRSAVNAVRFAPPIHRWIGAGFFAGSLLLFAALAVGFAAILAAARAAGGEAVQASLIERTVLFLFLFLLAGGVPFVSGVLLSPGDLPLLAAAPVRPAVIVVTRLIDAVIASSGQFVVIGVPLLVASAWAAGPGVLGWLAFLPLLLLFLVLPALAVAALLLVLARLVGVRRVKAAVAVASALLALAMCLLTVQEFSRQSNNASRAGVAATTGRTITRFGIQVNLGDLPPPLPKWLPSTWVSDALLALGSGGAGAPFGLLLAATVAAGVVCVAVGGPVLVGESLLEGEGGGRRGDGRPAALDRLLALLPLAPPVRALLAKDFRYVVRDLVLLSQVGIPVILYFVPFVIAGQIAAGGADARQDLLLLSAGVVATIVYMETSILGLSSIGLEGRAFWLVLCAPVTSGMLVRAKFLSALLPAFLLCAPMLLFACAWFGAPMGQALLGVGVLFCACAALCGLGVGIAGLFPRFAYENPAHRASLSALVWGFVGATAYVLTAGVALGGGLFLSYQWQERSGAILAIAVGVFLVVSLATAVLPLLGARARLDGFAWEESG
jgi:hypothetical protein